jgi:hypothetical protein
MLLMIPPLMLMYLVSIPIIIRITNIPPHHHLPLLVLLPLLFLFLFPLLLLFFVILIIYLLLCTYRYLLADPTGPLGMRQW